MIGPATDQLQQLRLAALMILAATALVPPDLTLPQFRT